MRECPGHVLTFDWCTDQVYQKVDPVQVTVIHFLEVIFVYMLPEVA